MYHHSAATAQSLIIILCISKNKSNNILLTRHQKRFSCTCTIWNNWDRFWWKQSTLPWYLCHRIHPSQLSVIYSILLTDIILRRGKYTVVFTGRSWNRIWFERLGGVGGSGTHCEWLSTVSYLNLNCWISSIKIVTWHCCINHNHIDRYYCIYIRIIHSKFLRHSWICYLTYIIRGLSCGTV